MNTMIYSPSGSSAGLGFAVPSDTIKQVVPQIIKYGRVIQPGLGIGILPDHINKRYVNKGIVISTVKDGSNADDAGLKGMAQDNYGRIILGDIILKIEKKSVNDYNDIYHALESFKVGDNVELTYLRNKKKNKIRIKLQKIGN
jgi:S1-C subfamily serine protease